MGSIADRMASLGSPAGQKPRTHEPPEEGGKGMKGETSIIHHEDGTHSVHHHDGENTGPHEHLHEAMAHISAKHHPDESHSHVMHHEDGTHTSHHAKEGEVSGPHDHENMEALKSHMDRFLDEEKNEWSGEDYK